MSSADVYATLPLELRLLALSLRIPVAWTGEAHFKGENSMVVKTAQWNQGRRLMDKAGRHPNFDDATIQRMRAELELFVLKRKVMLGRWPYREDPEVLRFVRKLIEAGGLESSDKIAISQIIAPVLRKLNPRRRRREG
jgi:hypothetical protein